MSLKEIIREIVSKNVWLSGMADYEEGDLMAIVNQPEKFQEVTELNDLKALFGDLRNYDGVFKFKNLLFFNDSQYGCFVYDINDPNRQNYTEHFSIHIMTLESFTQAVNSLTK
jgi:hypothetical protein